MRGFAGAHLGAIPDRTIFATGFAVAICCLTAANPALALPVCEGGNRAERKLTCIVDGDTGWEAGVKWRMLGIDTPEISSPECEAEYSVGIKARNRLREMMAAGYRIQWSGDEGYFGRDLVRIKLSDGRLAGATLISEGLAQPWPNDGNPWCQ